ncbi:MAG: hypothetical protein DVB27_10325 [Verrucomicrobia bacterium]|nr:MAG: hypothetical protein DVB27_10325 [Verrucomicrobiota bacterium]
MSFLDRFKRTPSEDTAPAKEVKAPPAGVPARPARPAETSGSPRARGTGMPGFQPVEPQLLHEGPPADSTKLTCDIAELAERIARGQTGIRLTEIYRRVPEIFRDEIPPCDETEIRFPGQKMMRMLAGARAVPDVTVAGAEVAIRHHDEAIAKLREQHEQTLAARTAEHAASLTAAKAEKAEVRTALQARHEEGLRGSTENTGRLTGEIARLQRARMDRGENRRDVIDVAPAPEVHPPAADSGRLKIQRVRSVPIRPTQVQSR